MFNPIYNQILKQILNPILKPNFEPDIQPNIQPNIEPNVDFSLPNICFPLHPKKLFTPPKFTCSGRIFRVAVFFVLFWELKQLNPPGSGKSLLHFYIFLIAETFQKLVKTTRVVSHLCKS